MKRIALILFVLVAGHTTSSQLLNHSNGFNYQAALRQSNGEILESSPATMRFTFYNFNVNAPLVYQEVQDLETNEFGLINTIIGPGAGNGFSIVGNWENIYWGEYEVFMKVEVDLLNGNGYQSMGIQQIWAVPQALVAGKATQMEMGDLIDVHYPNAPQFGQTLIYDEEWENWVPSNFPADSDHQTLSVFLEEISIGNGNSVNLNSWCRDGNSGIAANAFLGTEDGHDLVFKTNAEERMRLGQDGGFHIQENVGIGIASSSSYKLHLHSSTNPAPIIKLTNSATGTTLFDGSQYGLTTAGDLQIMNWENTDMIFTNNVFERMRIKSNGNIGIGTGNPQSLLQLHTDSGIDTYMRFSNAGAGVTANDGVLLGLASAGDFNIRLLENTKMNFYTNDQVRMTITASGNVGLGTTIPTSKLSVSGNISATSLSTPTIQTTTLNADLVTADEIYLPLFDGGPTSGNLRYLMVNQDGEIVDSQQHDNAVYSYAISGAEFRGAPGVDYGINSIAECEVIEGDYSELWAPIHLPTSTYILEIKVYVQDYFADGNLTVEFMSRSFEFSGGNQSSASNTSSGSGGTQEFTIDPQFGQIDNTERSYFLKAYVAEDADPNGQILIRGVEIIYRMD